MEKTLAILLAVVMLLSAAPLSVLAADDVLGGAISGTNPTMWTLDQYGTLTIIGEGEMGDFGTTEKDDFATVDRSYPNLSNYGATGIVPDTFIKKVVVQEGITHIANYAFAAFYALEEVSLPSTLKSIGANAFNSCIALEEISFPASLETIGAYAFKQCTSLKSIVIPDSVTILNTEAFSGCTSLESITFSKNLRRIFDNCFAACESLKEVVIPESVLSVSIGTFFLCPNLESVTVLNKDCELGFMFISNDKASEGVITPTQSKTVLKGYTGSTAQDYAELSETYGTPITFEPLDGDVVEPHIHTEEVLPAKAATCTASGLTEGKKCSSCGEILTAQQVIPAKGHSYGAWAIQSKATCEAAGVEKRACACGEAETRSIAATGHTDADGNNVCDTCGETLNDDSGDDSGKEEESKSFIDKIKEFFQSIIDWFKNLFNF